MTDAQKHFSQLIEQQQQLNADINALTIQLNAKRDLSLKVQGAIEYLEQTGVTLPVAEEVVEEKKEEEKTEESPEVE